MGDKTAIEWAEATWNPLYGCTKVGTECFACYIDRTPPYRMAGLKFDRKGHIPIVLKPDRLDQPLRWKRPRTIFVNSLSDLFHKDVPTSFIHDVFMVMAAAQQHTFIVLTKRPERMRHFCQRLSYIRAEELEHLKAPSCSYWPTEDVGRFPGHPLPNVILGVTAGDQRGWDKRVGVLLATPAARRMVSIEPLLGPVDMSSSLYCHDDACTRGHEDDMPEPEDACPRIDWIVAGGESGNMRTDFGRSRALVEPCPTRYVPGEAPALCEQCHGSGWRPKRQALRWLRSIRDQCVEAGVAFHFKGWGGPTAKSGGRLLDGRTWDEVPS